MKKLAVFIMALIMTLSSLPFTAFADKDGWSSDLDGLSSTSNKPCDIAYSEKGVHISGTKENDALAMSKTRSSGGFVLESDVSFTSGNVANLIFGAQSGSSSEESLIFKLDRTNLGETKIFCFSSSRGFPLVASNNGNRFEMNKSDYHMKVSVIDGMCAVEVDGVTVCSAKLPAYYKDGYIGLGTAEHSAAYFQNTRFRSLGDSKIARITGITVEGSVLTPAFSEDISAYGVLALPYEKESADITVTVSEGDGELTVGEKRAEGGRAVNIPLNVGKNVIQIVLTDPKSGIGVPFTVSVTRKASDELYMTEQYRDQYHFSPLEGWMNDPNGLIYLNGKWHMFFQYIPLTTAESGSAKHWGHAVSDDLVYWTELPVALAPDKELGAIWSGSAVADPENRSGLFDGKSEDNLAAFFTHRSDSDVQVQSLAYSNDGGLTWTKYEGNPVISRADDPLGDYAFRDPNVFWCEQFGKFIMAVAGGPLRIYSSDDLVNWKFESGYDNDHPSYRPAGVSSIYSECPDLFPLKVEGEDTVKWIYTGAGDWYMIGDLKEVDGRICFIPDNNSRYPLEFGYDAYAGVTFKNGPDGRVVMVSWMANGAYVHSMPTDPWNGSFTLCYDLTLRNTSKGLRVYTEPAKEYEKLRGDPIFETKGATVTEDSDSILADCRADVFELIAHITPEKGTKEVYIELLKGVDRSLVIKYAPSSGRITIDRSNVSAVKPGGYGGAGVSDHTLIKNADGSVDIRLYIDKGSAELIANNGQIYAADLIFPDPASLGMSIGTKGGSALADITVYPLSNVWRKTESDKAEQVYIDVEDGSRFEVGREITVHSRVLWDKAPQKVVWTLEDPDKVAQIKAQSDETITFVMIKEGEFTLSASLPDNSAKAKSRITVGGDPFKTNLTNWSVSGNGSFTVTGDGYSGSTSGDGFSVSEEIFKGDFRMSFDVILHSGTAFGVVFCSEDQPGSGSYMVNFDLGTSSGNGQMFRWTEFPHLGSDSDNAKVTFRKSVTPEYGKKYHIDISFIDGRLTYIFDGKTIFDGVKDKNARAVYKSGHIGIMGYSSSFTVNDLYVYTSETLGNITLSAGQLTPSFDPAVGEYTANVTNETEFTELTAAFEGYAKLTVNGKTLESGARAQIPLEVGRNVVNVVFEGIDGGREYVLSINRAESAAYITPEKTANSSKTAIIAGICGAALVICGAIAAAVLVKKRKKS